MAWIRLSDNYIDHPKFTALSDGAFRLWHEAIAYCRRHQTDGLVARATMVKFPHYRSKRLDELTAAVHETFQPLLVKVEGFGFKLHDYLEWNPSKDEDAERRADSKERMRLSRDRRVARSVAPSVAAQQPSATSVFVPVRYGTDQGKEENDDVAERAGRLLDEWYPGWYAELRGARLRLVANPLTFQDAVSVCQTWDDERIEKLARIFLTTDDDWISKTDRGFRVFAMKASWCDSKLAEWEKAQVAS